MGAAIPPKKLLLIDTDPGIGVRRTPPAQMHPSPCVRKDDPSTVAFVHACGTSTTITDRRREHPLLALPS